MERVDSMDGKNNPNEAQVVYAPPPYPWSHSPYAAEEDETNLLDYWRVIQKRKIRIIIITLLFTGLGILSCFVMAKKYQATATIMPPTQSGGGGGLSALAGQASSIPGIGDMLSGMGGGAGIKAAPLVNFLKSRTLTEQVIRQLNLMPVIYKKQWDPSTQTFRAGLLGGIPNLESAVRQMQKKLVKVTDDKKTTLIKIEVTLKDPVMAAAVANRMLIDLQDFIEKNSVTVAKRNRIFIEEQLRENKIQLLEAGKKLNQFYNSNRISSIQPQLDVDIGNILDTPKPLEDIRTSLAEVQQQKQDLDEKIKSEEKAGVVVGVPSQVYLQYLTLQRELLGRVNMLLVQQYEMAKIEESREDLSFQVVDKAVVPIKPVSPIPVLNVFIGFMAGLFLSVCYAFFLEYLEKLKKLEALKKR